MQHINKMAREKHGPSDLGFASPRWGWRREPQAVELLQTSTKMAARFFFPTLTLEENDVSKTLQKVKETYLVQIYF